MKHIALLCLILLLPTSYAATLTEDFESYTTIGVDPDLKPDQDWYDYQEVQDVGNITSTAPIPEGVQAFRFTSATGVDISTRRANFRLSVPIQISETTFMISGSTINDNGIGSMQFLSIDSKAPTRSIAQFFLFCRDTNNPAGCDLNVRWQHIDTIGQTLINASLSQTTFKIRVVMDWLDAEFCLFVDDVDDGCFPMLELPQDVGRLRFGMYRSDVPWAMTFDNWTIVGGQNATTGVTDADVADGIKNFATDIRFTSSGSLFALGLVVLIILVAAVLVPAIALGKDNSVAPAVSFYALLCVLWLIYIEFWPDWIGIGLIVTAAAIIGTLLRRTTLGIKDATTNAGLVVGALGYFIIASTFLGFSGYAAETIQVPTGPADQSTVNQTSNPDQSFLGAVTECVVTGGVFTFGLKGDCSSKTVSKTWKQITDVLGWVRSGMDFLFQLLTFSLPIPVIFNIMIVLPPAAALATVAIGIIRGSGA